jgi:hypothetical protein
VFVVAIVGKYSEDKEVNEVFCLRCLIWKVFRNLLTRLRCFSYDWFPRYGISLI